MRNYFAFVAALYGVSFWLPTLIKALGFVGIRQIGLMTALPYAAAVVTMLALAWNSDRTGERRKHLALAGLLGAVFLILSVLLRATPMWGPSPRPKILAPSENAANAVPRNRGITRS